MPQHRPHLELRIAEHADHLVDRLLVARRLDRPSRHLRLVGDEEVVQVPADEPAASRLLHDDVEDVLAVEPPLVAEEDLLAVVVVFRPILELPGEPAVGCARDLGLEGPAGEGAGAFANIGLGVVAGAEAEQLQQLAAPVLVDRGAVVLLVVQPEHHRRVVSRSSTAARGSCPCRSRGTARSAPAAGRNCRPWNCRWRKHGARTAPSSLRAAAGCSPGNRANGHCPSAAGRPAAARPADSAAAHSRRPAGCVSGFSSSSTVASYPLATRASSSSRVAPKPARRIR